MLLNIIQHRRQSNGEVDKELTLLRFEACGDHSVCGLHDDGKEEKTSSIFTAQKFL